MSQVKKFTKEDFLSRLKISLENASLTQKALAERSGLSPSTINQYLKGTRTPGAAEIFGLCTALEVSADFLVFGEVREFTTENSEIHDIEEFLTDADDLDFTARSLSRLAARIRSKISESDEKFVYPDKKSFSNIAVAEPRDSEELSEIPYYGQVAAGEPAAVDFYQEDTKTVPGNFARRPHYLLQVRGQSMEPNYRDGSFVVVRALEPGEYPRKGDIVIADDGGGPCMKRLEYRKMGPKSDTPRKPTAHLVSINPDFDDVIPVTDTPIQGVVVDSFEEEFFET